MERVNFARKWCSLRKEIDTPCNLHMERVLRDPFLYSTLVGLL